MTLLFNAARIPENSGFPNPEPARQSLHHPNDLGFVKCKTGVVTLVFFLACWNFSALSPVIRQTTNWVLALDSHCCGCSQDSKPLQAKREEA